MTCSFPRYLKVTERGDVRLDTNAIKGAARTDGKWVIETNDDTLTPEDAASAYKGLMVIERCFRTLKTTQLKLEPVYHRLSRRIEAHVKICVMALLIERVTELACDQPWSQLRPILARLQVTEVHILSHVLFKRNQPTQAVRNLFNTLHNPLYAYLSLCTPGTQVQQHQRKGLNQSETPFDLISAIIGVSEFFQ